MPVDTAKILAALPEPVLIISPPSTIEYANFAAEEFFGMGSELLKQRNFSDVIPPASPVNFLIEKSLQTHESFNEYDIDLTHPYLSHSTGKRRIVDLQVVPLYEQNCILLVIQPRSMAYKIDQQLTHRGAARSVSGMAAMLAHEIKNPLSGIKGAAQLLELDNSAANGELTQLICDETDRIAALVDQFEVFTNQPPQLNDSINMHSILDHIRRLAVAGFGAHVKFIEQYDPSLPHVLGNKDMLIQAFLNLIKNAVEAIGDQPTAEIKICSAFRPGIKLTLPGRVNRVSLPLEFSIIDNGPGVSEDIAAHLFDPFVTDKTGGSGLGLAMVAKIIGDHGGIVEYEHANDLTVFRVLLPMAPLAPSKETNEAHKE